MRLCADQGHVARYDKTTNLKSTPMRTLLLTGLAAFSLLPGMAYADEAKNSANAPIPNLETFLRGDASEVREAKRILGKIREGDIEEASRFFRVPVILVCEFKTEYEREYDTGMKTMTIHYCRVIASNIPDLPFGSVVAYGKLHEGLMPQTPPASGQIFLILSAYARQKSTLNSVIELSESCHPLPLRATSEQIDTAIRAMYARQCKS